MVNGNLPFNLNGNPQGWGLLNCKDQEMASVHVIVIND